MQSDGHIIFFPRSISILWYKTDDDIVSFLQSFQNNQ